MLREEILNILSPYLRTRKISNKVKETYWKNKQTKIYNTIYNEWDQSIGWPHFLYNFLYNLDTPLCKYCKTNEVSFAGFNKGYKTFCSKGCAVKDPDQKIRIQTTLKETVLEKYGVDNISKLDSIKAKKKATTLKNYGAETNFERKEVLDKFNNSDQDKIERCHNTILNKYGTYSSLHIDRVKKLNIEKFDRIKNLMTNDSVLLEINYDLDILYFNCNKCNTDYEIKNQLFNLRVIEDKPICTNCNPINKMYSYAEKEVFDFIKNNYNGKVIPNTRDVKYPHELDIYLPELNLGIEYNGLYWHNELNKPDNYHQKKHDIFKEINIQIINIFEDDWLYKQNIVKSRLLNLLNKSDKIYARKCSVKEVSQKEKETFLNENHIQGNCISKYNIGLYLNDNLVSLMCFGKRAMNIEIELLRFCNKLNTTIIGGASKLFKWFINNYEYNEIVSYADLCWSNGNLYRTLNFEYVSKTKPNYYYIVSGIRENRLKYTKQNLIKYKMILENETERECMFRHKRYRIYDCGSLKYKYTKI